MENPLYYQEFVRAKVKEHADARVEAVALGRAGAKAGAEALNL